MFNIIYKISFFAFFTIGCTQQNTLDDLVKFDQFTWLESRDGKKPLEWVKKQNLKTTTKIIKTERYNRNYKEAVKLLANSGELPNFVIHGKHAYALYKNTETSLGVWKRISLKMVSKPLQDWESLIDFNALSSARKSSLSFYYSTCLKPEERFCLIEISHGGTDITETREFDLKTKKFVKDGFYLAKGKITQGWVDRDHIVYTRGEKSNVTQSGYSRQAVLLSRKGLKKKLDIPIPEKYHAIIPYTYFNGSRNVSIAVSYKGEQNFDSYYVTSEGAIKINLPNASQIRGFVNSDLVFSLSNHWSFNGKKYVPGSVLAVNFKEFLQDDTRSKAVIKTIFNPTEPGVVPGKVLTSKNFVAVNVLNNVVGKIQFFQLKGSEFRQVPVEFTGDKNVHIEAIAASYPEDTFFFTSESFVQSKILDSLKLKIGKETFKKSIKVLPAALGIMTVQKWARGHDGTSIPYFVVGKQSVLNKGNAPTILAGYGSYGYNWTPKYSPVYKKLWIEKGGLFAVANVRGGGELGRDWYRSGVGQKKVNSIKDFLSVSQELISSGASQKGKLGIYGGSMGGLVMGGAFALKPEYYNAAVGVVPVLNISKGYQISGGNWIDEVGDPLKSEDLASILKYSPYHNLKEGVKYPPFLAYAVHEDQRVHPGHSRKMVAKLQKFNNKSVFMFEDFSGGHSISSTIEQKARWKALMMTFFQNNLGL